MRDEMESGTSLGSNDDNSSAKVGGADLVITVKEARKLLGKDLRELTDDQVETIITRLDSIARNFIASRV
jgi:hypothetical protein